MKKFILIIIYIIAIKLNPLVAQVYYYEQKTDKQYEINQKTDKDIINSFLIEQNATAIEFNSSTDTRFPFRVKNKRGNWMLYDHDDENIIMVKESRKYSFQFPTPLMKTQNLSLAIRNGKKYFVNLSEHQIHAKIAFDEIKPRTITKNITVVNTVGEFEDKNIQHLTSFTVKNNNLWGLIEFADDNFYLSRNLLYNSPEEVPLATGFNTYQLQMMESLRKNYKLDLLIALDTNGYMFKGRNKKTELFGIYGGEGTGQSYISSNYNNLKVHGNNTVFEVWKDGKVGYYNSDFNLVFEPIFDDFQYVHLDYKYGCALKQNGEWELYDMYEPVKTIQGKAESINELIALWLNR
ncbi:hypothetical protein O4H26_08325 [Aequorivita viscosa]|nr:hypothetical protein [Aequorivita viscosa]